MKQEDVKSTGARRKPNRAKKKAIEPEDFLTISSDVESKTTVSAAAGSLGQRIRQVRKTHGLTHKDISSRCGIDVAMLKLIESDEVLPPLGQLIRLGKALDMKMGYFISPGVDKPMTVVRKDQRRPVARHGEKKSAKYGYTYESLAPEKANRAMEPFIVTLLPTEAEEFSSHDGQEFLFVLDGEIKVQVDDEVEILKVGDSVYYDSNKPHLVKAAGQKDARILAVIYAESK